MEFVKKKAAKVDSFRGFIAKVKCNPINKEDKVLVAKDVGYPYQTSEEAYVLLLPLAVKNLYMYIQPYVDAKTNVTEYCLRISRIVDLEISGNSQVYTYDGNKQEDIRFNKGVRYVKFLADYFDEEKNKNLYKVSKNNRMVCEKKIKHDTDKVEYKDRCGYVEIHHLRVQNEGKCINYVQLMCVKSFKGVRQPAMVSVLMDNEWKYIHRYLNFVIGFYNLDSTGTVGGLEKKRIDSARRDVMEIIGKIDAEASKKKDDGNKTSSDGNKVGDKADGSKNKAGDKADGGKTSDKTDENKTDQDVKGRRSDDREDVENGEKSSSSKKRKLSKNSDVKLVNGKDEVDSVERNNKKDDKVCVENYVEDEVESANMVVSSSKKRKILEKSSKNVRSSTKKSADKRESAKDEESNSLDEDGSKECDIEKELMDSIKRIRGREPETVEKEQDEYEDGIDEGSGDNENNNSEHEIDDYDEEYSQVY